MRGPFKILGVEIGTSDGWDEVDFMIFQAYDFEPGEKFKDKLPAGDTLTIDFIKGIIEYIDDEGNVEKEINILEALRD